jgi:hypothetical protein
MAHENRDESLKERMILLSHGREIAAKATKRRESSRTVEGSRNLLLHLDHPEVALGLIIGSSRQLHRLHL